MELIDRKCVNCDASLKIKEGAKTCKCKYCDTEYTIIGNELRQPTRVEQTPNEIYEPIITMEFAGEKRRFYVGGKQVKTIYGDNHKLLTSKMVVTLIEI